VTAGLTLSLVGCGIGSTDERPDAERSRTALKAGLKAHTDGRLRVASIDYRLALDYNHRNKHALFNLALLDAASGNHMLAQEKYRGVLKLDPDYGPALFNLAILRTDRGDLKEAIQLYERAVAANNKAAGAMLNLGLLQRAIGQRSVGDKNVLKATALNPKLKDPLSAKAYRSPVPQPARKRG